MLFFIYLFFFFTGRVYTVISITVSFYFALFSLVFVFLLSKILSASFLVTYILCISKLFLFLYSWFWNWCKYICLSLIIFWYRWHFRFAFYSIIVFFIIIWNTVLVWLKIHYEYNLVHCVNKIFVIVNSRDLMYCRWYCNWFDRRLESEARHFLFSNAYRCLSRGMHYAHTR